MNQKINEKLTEQDVQDIFINAQLYAKFPVVYTFALDYRTFFRIDLRNSYFFTSVGIINQDLNDYEENGQAQNSIFNHFTDKKAKDLKAFYLKWDKKHLKPFTSFTKLELQELASDIYDLSVKYDYDDDGIDRELYLGAISFPKQGKQAYQQQLDRLENLDSENLILGCELNLCDKNCLLEIVREKDNVDDVVSFLEGYYHFLKYHYIDEHNNCVNDDKIFEYQCQAERDLEKQKKRLKFLIETVDRTIKKEN